MRAHSLLLLTTLAVSLLTEVNGKKGRPLGIYKCCGMFQMLSGDGQSCVDAPWPRGYRPRLHRFIPSEKTGVLLRRSDAAWVARWLPPGLPLDRVWAVFLDGRTRFYYKPVVQTVREAVLGDKEQEMAAGAAYWRGDRAYFSKTYEGVARTIKNPWPPIKQRKAVHSSWYCVDAARPPLAPFALLSDVNCAYEDCFIKCCDPGEVMAAKAGGWMCEDNPRGYWTPHNSSFASFVPADVPFKRGKLQVERSGGVQDWKRFLVLSALAWGVPAVMTGLCAHAYEWDRSSLEWFTPTLMETRTCFDEVYSNDNYLKLLKSGTALFYYAPVGLLIAVNCICIARTLKTVHFLRRGNSVLRRDEDNLHRPTEGRGTRATKPQTSDAVRSSVADAKAIKTYVKMVVMTGGAEIIMEIVFWWASAMINYPEFYFNSTFAFRATGYVADCSRATCVVWLAAPEQGYFHALRRLWTAGKRGRDGGRARGKLLRFLDSREK